MHAGSQGHLVVHSENKLIVNIIIFIYFIFLSTLVRLSSSLHTFIESLRDDMAGECKLANTSLTPL